MQYVKFCYLLRIYLVNSKKSRTFAVVSISKVTFSLRINQRSLSCGCIFLKKFVLTNVLENLKQL